MGVCVVFVVVDSPARPLGNLCKGEVGVGRGVGLVTVGPLCWLWCPCVNMGALGGLIIFVPTSHLKGAGKI